jgi:hypothetical protein
VGFSNWDARYGESAIPPLMGHPGLLIQDYVAGIPIWYIPNILRVTNANKRNGFVVCPCSVCKNLKNYSSSRPFTCTCFSTVSCPATIVGPSTEKEVLQWKTMKKRMMTTILGSLNMVILSWEKLKGELKGKLKERHMMMPLMISVGPLLMHGENAKLIRRGRSWIAC